jgi:hypothetical protein
LAADESGGPSTDAAAELVVDVSLPLGTFCCHNRSVTEAWGTDRTNARVRDRVAAWRGANRWLENQELRAREDPRAFVSMFVPYVLRQRRHIRRFLFSRFGVKVNYHRRIGGSDGRGNLPGLFGEQYVAVPERFPLRFWCCPEDYSLFHWYAAWGDLLYWFDGAWMVVVLARMDAARRGIDPDVAVVEEVFNYHRVGPSLITRPTRQTEIDPLVREEHAENLAGWVGSRIGVGTNKRLGAVLGEDLEPGGSIFERLVGQLLPTTVIAFDDLRSERPPEPEDEDEPLLDLGRLKSSLVSRVEKLLEELGGQGAKLARRGKLSGERLESTIPDDEDGLEEFELRETLRQELETLKSLVERAAFSEREARVFGLDMETDHDTAAISRELRLEPETVRTYRKRYRDKLRRAAGL